MATAQDEAQWSLLINMWGSQMTNAVIKLEDTYEKWGKEHNEIITAKGDN